MRKSRLALLFGNNNSGATPLAPAPPVTSLAAIVNSDRSVTLTWVDSAGATSYAVKEDGVTRATVLQTVQTATIPINPPMKLSASALPTLASLVNTPPDFTGYNALNVPGIAQGQSYVDPRSGQRVYKLILSDGLGLTRRVYGDYTNGGSGRHISLPLDVSGKRRVLYFRDGEGWRLIDMKVNAVDATLLDTSNDRLLGGYGSSLEETQFAFSNNPALPHIAYTLIAVGGFAIVSRWDTTTNTEAPNTAFPAGGHQVAWSAFNSAQWLTVSDDESVVAWQGYQDGVHESALFYHTATGTVVTWTPASAFDEGKLSPDGSLWMSSGPGGDLVVTVDTTTGLVIDTSASGFSGHSAPGSGNVWPVHEDALGGYYDPRTATLHTSSQSGDSFVRWEYLVPTWRQPTLSFSDMYWLAVADSDDSENVETSPTGWSVYSGAVYVATPTLVGAYANHVGEPLYGCLMTNEGVRTISGAGGNINNLERIIGSLVPVASIAALTSGVQGVFWDQANNKLYVRLADDSDPTGRLFYFVRSRGGGANQVIGFQEATGADLRLLCHSYSWVNKISGGDQDDGSASYYWRTRPSQSADGAVVLFGSTMARCGGRTDLFITFPPLVSA